MKKLCVFFVCIENNCIFVLYKNGKDMENSQKPAFATSSPSCDKYDGVLQEGLTKREYACIKLGIPETGDPELDDLIRKAERKRIAENALNGLLSNSNVQGTEETIVRASVVLANQLLKQLNDE